ncbi:MAG: hypothetical protein IIA91_00205 [Chloroflexi bacterium]|nr:hypothetical protein [Chloroflexota bacterium]
MPKRNQPTKLCYVIMPFSKTKTCSEEEWTDIFEAVIKPAIEGARLGYNCLRSEATTGNVISKVVNSLYQANIVIADLTDRNPNVFYELGVRHTLKNRTIMVAQRRKDIPSDLHGYASHVYKWKTTADKQEFKKKLGAVLRQIENDADRSDNPVSDFLHQRSLDVFEFRREESARKLAALGAELGLMASFLEDAVAEESNAGHEDANLQRPAASQVIPRLSSPALDHLIATQYVSNSSLAALCGVLRGLLEVLGQREASNEEIANVQDLLRALRSSIEKVAKAHAVGDSIEELEIEVPEWMGDIEAD